MHEVMFQGVTGAQAALVSYWAKRRDSSGRVPRESIDAGDLRSMLASLSIVEFDPNGACRFRVAGSRLCALFGQELRGRDVCDVMGDRGEAFLLSLAVALERGGPAGGVTQTEAHIETGANLHAWLRLPLADASGQLCQVLCHDELVHDRALLPGFGTLSRSVLGNGGRAAA